MGWGGGAKLNYSPSSVADVILQTSNLISLALELFLNLKKKNFNENMGQDSL